MIHQMLNVKFAKHAAQDWEKSIVVSSKQISNEQDTDEQKVTIENEDTDSNDDEMAVRGTRSLFEIYSRCN